MNILMIGGTRFIGRAAVYQLAAAGHTVTVFHRGKTILPLPDGVQHIHGDLANLDDFRDDFRALAPDVVVHMLLMEQGEATQMMRVFRGIAERVVVVSSADVYLAWGRLLNTEPGDPLPVPLTEQSPLREERYPYRKQLAKDDWRYYYDKISVEETAMGLGRPAATVVRLPMVYGPHDPQRRIAAYLQRMKNKRPFIALDARQYNWRAPRGYVDNIGHALALAATHKDAARRIYHVAERYTDALTEAQWVRAIGDAAGWQGEVIAAPPEKLPRSMRFNPNGQSVTLDSSRIRAELGYDEKVSFRPGLVQTVAWTAKHVLPQLDPIDYTMEDALVD